MRFFLYIVWMNVLLVDCNIGSNKWCNPKKILCPNGESNPSQPGEHHAIMVHSHLQFSQLLLEPVLIVEQWVTLYYMGAFTPAIWSTIVWTEKFNNGLCTHFLWLHGLKSSRNSSCLKNRRCELSLRPPAHHSKGKACPHAFWAYRSHWHVCHYLGFNVFCSEVIFNRNKGRWSKKLLQTILTRWNFHFHKSWWHIARLENHPEGRKNYFHQTVQCFYCYCKFLTFSIMAIRWIFIPRDCSFPLSSLQRVNQCNNSVNTESSGSCDSSLVVLTL